MEKLRRSVGKLFFAGKPYRAMVQKIYREMLGVMAKSFLIILAIRVLGYQKIGNFLTELLIQLKDCSWSEAQSLYFTYIRSNIEYLMFYAFLFFFIIFMTFYFNIYIYHTFFKIKFYLTLILQFNRKNYFLFKRK